MRKLLTVAACLAVLLPAVHAQSPYVLRNARVRVVKTLGGVGPPTNVGPAVVVQIQSGEASWTDDLSGSAKALAALGPLVIVEPRNGPAAGAPPPSATLPGGAQFTGMSFKPIFENDKVRVIRARMEVDAREGFHTHAADTIVVHLSGGEIEDTANGKTVVNKWKPGDVEFEARGSSHSARNVGSAIDVVLVALK